MSSLARSHTASLLLLALAAVTITAEPAGAQSPTHVYHVDGSLTDALGGPSLTPAGGTVGADRYDFRENQGLTLANALDPHVYSLELSFSMADVRGYRKVVDFTNREFDLGFYVYSGRPVFHVTAGSAWGSDEVLFAAATPAHLVLTRDADRRFAAYVNGALALSFVDDLGRAKFGGTGNVATLFFDDLRTRTEASTGSLYWARTYDVALTAAQVKGRFAAGDAPLPPVTTTPEPAGAALLAAGLAAVGATAARRRRTANT